MNNESSIEELIALNDPLSEERASDLETHCDHIWSDIETRVGPPHPRRRRRIILGSASLTSVVALGLVLASVLAGTPTLSAAAAELTKAAQVDTAAATLPILGAGQFYYQESAVSMVCGFSSPSMPAGETITYISDGTMQSWTNAQGLGRVTITPSPVDANGSHFATAQEQAEWIAAGRPFVPCALGNASNGLSGNPANADPTSPLGGYAVSGVGYGGFGFDLASNSVTTDLASSTNVNNLPTDVAQIAVMLANGEIDPDGSLASSPQVCPADSPPRASVGCSTAQQLAVIELLLQWPDASAKLGATLYQVMAHMPGASITQNVTDALGQSGIAVTVPTFEDEEFEAVLNPTTGTLLSCAELQASNDGLALSTPSSEPYEPIGQISYGSLAVVSGIGTVPSTAS